MHTKQNVLVVDQQDLLEVNRRLSRKIQSLQQIVVYKKNKLRIIPLQTLARPQLVGFMFQMVLHNSMDLVDATQGVTKSLRLQDLQKIRLLNLLVV